MTFLIYIILKFMEVVAMKLEKKINDKILEGKRQGLLFALLWFYV